MDKKITIAILIILAVIILAIFFYFQVDESNINKKPIVGITYPIDGTVASKIITISGTAIDPDDDNIERVEVTIDNEWNIAEGNNLWSYEWKVFDMEDGFYTVKVRCWDGTDYSEIEEVIIEIDNPVIVDNGANKWAVFIAASNFPEENESKLGNGALNLAERISAYFIESLGYSTSNIILLFDDGWIRDDNGYGKPILTLDQRRHEYDITYGAATKETVISAINYVVDESNKFSDSEIFIWVSSHGCGNSNRFFGGRLLKESAFFLWDNILSDNELSELLSGLKSKKTCIIVDACYSGGFADKTILNLPEFFPFRTDLSKSGRVVMSSASKFRVGYASTTEGPLFSQLWFYGIVSGEADGFRPSILKTGRPTRLKIFKDGKVSVEEAFYYARYILRTSENLQDYNTMEPQINDKYPKRGFLGSNKGLVLGE